MAPELNNDNHERFRTPEISAQINNPANDKL